MSGEQPFIRQVEVYISAVEEWRGGGTDKQKVKIFGNGDNDHLRIRFQVRKHIMSTPAPTVISIYNLGAGLRNSLQKSNAEVELKVGWRNTEMVTIFSGSLLAAYSRREDADIITDLTSLSGYGGLSRSVISEAFAEGMAVSDIVKKLAGQIEGVTVGKVDIASHQLGNQGLSDTKSAKDWIDNLARVYGFSWWIDKNVFYAIDDKKSLTGGQQVVLSSKNGFLISAEPMLAAPMQKLRGVTMVSLLNPYVETGHNVKLESSVNPSLNGSYKVHTLSMNGDTHSNQWEIMIESFLTL